MQINFVYDPSVANAPAGFLGGLAAAASYLDALITNPITVTIQVGWGENDGSPISGNEVATGGPAVEGQFYTTVRRALAANAMSAADALAVANLPATDPLSGNILEVSTAEEKALGLTSFSGIDGSIGFGTTVPFTFDPANRAVPGKTDFIGVAEHEMTHALGRISGLFSTLLPGVPSGTPLDLFRYTSPGVNAQTSTQPAYFSIDGGKTSLDPLDTVSDPADWASSIQGDSFAATSQTDTVLQVTPADIAEMDVLGFGVAPLLTGSYGVTAAPSESLLNLSGVGEVTLAPGDHTLNVVGGADTIFGAAASDTTTILDYGAVFFYAGAAPQQAADLLSGSGGATLVGAANNVLIDQGPGADAGALLVAGAGNETLFGAGSSTNDQYWGGFQDGNDFMAAGGGNDILVAGDGAGTLIGGTGTDVFYVISSRLLGAILNAPVGAGQDAIYNAHPGDTLALTGFDSLYGAAGSGAAARSVSAALKSGSDSVELADGTTISFVGGGAGLNVVSS